MLSSRRALVVVSVLSIAAVDVSGGQPGRNPAGGRSMSAQDAAGQSEIASEIAKMRELWVTEWNLKQIYPIVAMYAPDAMFLTASGQRAVGQAAIRALFEG